MHELHSTEGAAMKHAATFASLIIACAVWIVALWQHFRDPDE